MNIQNIEDGDLQTSAGETPAHAGATLEDEPPTAEEIQLWLVSKVAELVAVDPDEMDITEPFARYGLDSIAAAGLSGDLEDWLNRRLPPTLVWDYPTIELLAQHLASVSEVGAYLPEHPAGDEGAVPAREGDGRAKSSHAEGAHDADGHAGSLYPLSHNQRSLWFMQQFAPESPAYNIMMAWRVRSEVDPEAMRRACQKVIDRHASLRTTYTTGPDGAPLQHVHAGAPVGFETADVSGMGDGELSALVADRAHRPFDLQRGPLIRFELFTRSAREHVLLLSVHHIVVDFGSVAILMDELFKLYRTEAGGAAAVLDSPGANYTDYVRWQNELLAGPEGERLGEYWRQRLAGKLPLLEVPTDRPRQPTRPPRGAMHTFKLDEELTTQLKALAKAEGVTLYTLLLAASQMLLQRQSGQRELIIGSPASGRGRADFEKTVGYFANPVVFRADFNGNPTFRNFLGQVRQTVLGALAHQDYPFPLLVEALQVPRDPSRSPLCEAVFILLRPRRAGAGESGAQSMSPLEVFLLAQPGAGFEVEGLTLEYFEFEQRVARFDLVLFLIETSGLLSGLLQYNKDLFERATAERLCAGFENLLRGIVARPDARLTTFETRSQNVEERQSPESEGKRESKLGRLKGARRRAVDLSEVSVVTAEPLREGELLPLVLRPAAEHVDLLAWARGNRDFVESHLLRHGAILFRGFNLSAASEFERLAESLCGDLFHEYADLPREEVSGKVYGSTPYPADQAILFHNESSHMHCWPLKVWFFCETAAETGGETPVADCRRVYREMSPELREPFERKGLMYVRNFVEGFDVRWQDFFRTQERAAVEAKCRQTGMEAEWLEGGNLRLRQLCPAVADHPKTGERVFFNQIQAHHVSCLDPDVRRSMLSLFGEENMPRNVYYGDGSVIEDGVMDAVREVYGAAAVAFPWREGDVLMLDNMLTAHGRNPYTGQRKIFVTMGEMVPPSRYRLREPLASPRQVSA